ncbi:hypothetical protein C7437_10889 [Psychrobacillus insolitus]|uniref:Uncharacterized protein n=1 Tax=Psychrobacillus insolitus TaxID=1461 RepID=A0A2W7MF98_9BACI|nr:hypothetical protein [Psychrobacillus insolitus]PZX02993.1 hypothetical protein C7437_10889 [Psychrobacillus insolitus]
MIPEDPKNDLPPHFGETIEFLGSVILTIGYIVSTIGEGIVLSELTQAKEDEKKSSIKQDEQLSDIQSKLDYLVSEMEVLKKRGSFF